VAGEDPNVAALERWLWDRTPLSGHRIRVRCFHGLGDTIQFYRFLPRLMELCRKVTFLPQPEMAELTPAVYGAAEPDLEIELMELPHAPRATPETIPASVPYLHVPGVPPVREGNGFRAGLAWASGAWCPERSVPLNLFSLSWTMCRSLS
jgi:hypothetical protein